MNGPKWAVRLARWTPRLGIIGALIAAIGSFGSGLGLWVFTTGFLGLGLGLLCAILAIITGLLALWLGRGHSLPKSGVWIGLIAALGLVLVFGNTIRAGAGHPMIHDVTTNSASPPQFVKLTVRADNLVGVDTIENWRKIHDAAYADIKPLVLPMFAPKDAIARAKALVQARGWEIALATPDRIEATASTRIFRFKDDVVITATAIEKGGARVDMRSVSRVGVGDLGVNAKRVREFLRDLSASR